MGEFPTDYQRWRRKAIREGYPRCTQCEEPIQKGYQKKGTLCRQCTQRKIAAAQDNPEYDYKDYQGTDAVRYERAGRD